MDSYSVLKYSSEYKNQWDKFINRAKNATFLLTRDFIEYHADRFQDHSLLIFKKEKLIALMPANIQNDVLYSHQGLTYGGFTFDKSILFKESLGVFKSVLKFLEEKGISTIELKKLPNIYSLMPSDEIDYIMFLAKAKLTRCDLSSTIANDLPLGLRSNRRQGIKKAEKNNLQIVEQQDFRSFWEEVLIPTLEAVHGESPVHSFQEIQLLKTKFPDKIRLFSVLNNNNIIIAGCVIFETEKVAHTQYIASNTEGREMSALDYLFGYLILEKFKTKKYFDFGISNENHGRNINGGLLQWKESFGARSIVHEFYQILTANHIYLKDVFL